MSAQPRPDDAPQGFIIEQAVLGALLQDAAAFELVQPMSPAHFRDASNAEIYRAIAAPTPTADLTEVFLRLRSAGKADLCGGLPNLNALAQGVPSSAHASKHAQWLRDESAKRDALALLDRLKLDLAKAQDAGEAIRHASDALGELARPIVGDTLRIVTADAFIRDLRIPTPLIDGLLPRGQLYSFTGPTGHGKTAIAATMQICIALGRPFAARDVERGRVLVLAGENPDDYALRLLATAQAMRISPALLSDIHIVPGSFAIGPAAAELEARARAIGDFAAVFVDTSAAFFGGDDENSNVDARAHASRLRTLCGFPGNPAAIVLCHPTKNALKENLLPRGGGAFLAEVDGNLTAWRDDKLATMHWAGKLRGPGFEPVTFELAPQVLEIMDAKGRNVPSVAAVPAGDERAEALVEQAQSDENRLLLAMLHKPRASVGDLGTAAGMTDGACRPQKSRVHRLLLTLQAQGLVNKTRGGAWALTNKGKTEAAEVQQGA